MASSEPKQGAAAFDCPSCGVRAPHRWFEVGVDEGALKTIPQYEREQMRIRQLKGGLTSKYTRSTPEYTGGKQIKILYQENVHVYAKVKGVLISRCEVCEEVFVWTNGKLIWPQEGDAPAPNPDLPKDIQNDYNEARSIVGRSPRSAAALLRLCVEKLCIHLGAKKDTTEKMIRGLVDKGLPREVEDALHVVRVIGNQSIHPGKLDRSDDYETAASLFRWVNFIARRMLSEPAELSEAFQSLPQQKRESIEKRRPNTPEQET